MDLQQAHHQSHSLYNDPIQEEIEWELGSVQRGADRYISQTTVMRPNGDIVERSLADLEPGQVIIRDIVARGTEAIRAVQNEAYQAIEVKKGSWSPWWFPMLSLPADVIAYLGAKAILLAADDPDGCSLRSVAMTIGRQMQVQRDYELWKEAENRREREIREKKKAGELPADLYVPNWWKLWHDLSGAHTEKTFAKWSKKAEHYERVGWDRETRLHTGSKVVHTLYEVSGGWFQCDLKFIKGGKTEYRISITEEARSWIDARHERNKEIRPWLLPMLVEPLDWTRVSTSVPAHID